MARCSVCQMTLKERLRNWRQDAGPFGFEVVAKVGSSSYKCVCNRCGHTWLSRTKQAAFQFNESEEHLRMKNSLEKAVRHMLKSNINGVTIP